MSSWLDCGERFRLERVLGAPQQNAWWFLGGSAFHKASELLDLGETSDPLQAWAIAWEEELQAVKPKEVLKAGGKVSAAYPNKEDKLWWAAKGPQMVVDYLKWREAAFEQGWQWWIMPDGKPAIEVPVFITYGDTLIKGYVDRVMVNPNGELVIVDLKSGSRVPESTLQLGTYARAFAHTQGVTATLGAYYMSRKGTLTDAKSLLHYTDSVLTQWYGSTKKAIENEIFIPKVGMFCGSCSVSKYCTAVGGNPELLQVKPFI